MAEKEADKSPVEDAAPAGGGGPGKLVLILTAVNVIATLAMGGVLFISFRKEQHKAQVEDITLAEGGGEAGAEGGGGHGGEGKGPAKKKNADFGKMIALDQFTINLSTPGTTVSKFARVNISLEVPTEDIENEVTSKMPQVRNAIIDLFNSKRPADLATAEGRDYLKDEIRSAINGFLVSGKVKGVFFTNFALSG